MVDTTHILDGVQIEERSDPALLKKLQDIGKVKKGDTAEVKFGTYTFIIEVIEVTDGKVVWKQINKVSDSKINSTNYD